jgi:adenine-specific DNA-methyltransferase
MATTNRMIRGDCRQVLKSLGANSVDLIVTSPPYNIGKPYETRQALAGYLAEQKQVIAECARALAPSGSIFWQLGSYSHRGMIIPLDVRLFPFFEEAGLLPRNRIVWVRQHGLHANRRFSCRHETMLWFTKSDAYKFHLDPVRVPQKYRNKKAWKGSRKGTLTCHPLGKNPGDVWAFSSVKHNHEERTLHPCQFPEALVARVVLATSSEGDLVLDPYAGSGTVPAVAKALGRRYIGIELDPSYCALARRRILGRPDGHGVFPNLKLLRAYATRTGTPPHKLRFALQTGHFPTGSNLSRMRSEECLRAELLGRLSTESLALASGLLDR